MMNGGGSGTEIQPSLSGGTRHVREPLQRERDNSVGAPVQWVERGPSGSAELVARSRTERALL